MANLNKSSSAAKKIDKYFYNFNDVLGVGSFGKVYQGRDETTGDKVAIKVIDLKAIEKNDQVLKNLSNEIKVMKSLMKNVSNPNIVKLYDVLTTSNNVYIIQEFCNGGDLRDLLKKRGRFPEPEALKILKDILSGFTVLKQKNIIHRDLKPENILISNNVYKLADFGFAKNVDNFRQDILKSLVGTPLYMSPQILQHSQYTAKSDIWSIGLIYYEMLYGITPYDAKSIWDLVKYIENKKLEFPREIPVTESSRNFIRRCLEKEEENRISWEEVFSYPLFQDCFQYKKKMTLMEEKGLKLINYLREKITSQNLNVNDVFKAFDTSKNDKLEISEFSEIINTIDPNMEKEEVEFIFNKMDSNGDNSISYREFCSILFSKFQQDPNAMQIEVVETGEKSRNLPPLKAQASETYFNANPITDRTYIKFQQMKDKVRMMASKPNFDIYRFFWTFDISEDQTLDLNEFAKCTSILDHTLGYDDVVGIFRIIDTNNDGRITIDEFIENFLPELQTGYVNTQYKSSPSRAMQIEESSRTGNDAPLSYQYQGYQGNAPQKGAAAPSQRFYQEPSKSNSLRPDPSRENPNSYSKKGPLADQYNGQAPQRVSLSHRQNDYNDGLDLKNKSNSTSYRKSNVNSISHDLEGSGERRAPTSRLTVDNKLNNYGYRSAENDYSFYPRQGNSYNNASFGAGNGLNKNIPNYDSAGQSNSFMVNGLVSRLKIRITQTYPSTSKLFSSYDTGRKGYLSRTEFQNMILSVEPSFGITEADLLFTRMDLTRRECVTCQEFQDGLN